MECSDKIQQGGAIAAPIASQVLGEVLPYLEVAKTQNNEDEYKPQVEMPDVIGLNLEEAKKILKQAGLDVEISETEGNNGVVADQLPKKGIQVNSGTKVTIYVQ